MKYLSILFLQLTALAESGQAGAHHAPSMSELIVPAINFAIVFGFIFWKAKAPLKRMFDENAVKVKELVELAQERDKEAQIKLDMYEKKMSGVSTEIETILSTAEKDGNAFEHEYLKEVAGNLEKITKDAQQKLESEKNTMIKMLNTSLLDEVISKAKNTLSSDKNLNTKTTANIVSKL